MPRYEVVEEVIILDEVREVGSVVEIDEALAAPHLEAGEIKLVIDEGATPIAPPAEPTLEEQKAPSTPPEVVTPEPTAPVAPVAASAPSGWVGGHSMQSGKR